MSANTLVVNKKLLFFKAIKGAGTEQPTAPLN